MPCPICGAKCQCKKRGPDGTCCACHRHKPRPIKREFVLRGGFEGLNADEQAALERHQAALEESELKFQRSFALKPESS